MKTLKLLMNYFSLMLFCVILFSCSKQDEVLNDDDLSLRTRSVEGKIPGPYEYETSYQNYPRYSSSEAGNSGYYFSFNFTPYSDYFYYTNKWLQLQYRFANLEYAECREELQVTPDSEWRNVGAYCPEIYSNGAIRLYDRTTFDVDARHFPTGRLNLRYRLRYGPNGGDPYYPDSEWTIISRFKVAYDNPEGYVNPDSLYISVSVPLSGGTYSYSVYVDNQQVQRQFSSGLFVCKRTKDNGTYAVSAMRHSYNPYGDVAYRSALKEGTYNKESKKIFIEFYHQDFDY